MPRFQPRRGQGELVYVEPSSVKALQRLAGEFKKASNGKALKKELTTEIKKATKPLEQDIKANARNMAFKGSGNGARARRTAGVTRTGRTRKGKGLRDSLVAGVKTEVSYRAGAGAGVRIRLKSSDAEINRLGRTLNTRGYIRHPLFGDEDHWYNTTSSNARDWFWKPVPKHRANVTRGVKRAIDRALDKIAKDIGR